MVGLFHHRQDFHLGEGGLASALIIKRRDAHQAMRALFHGKLAVHVLTMDYERG